MENTVEGYELSPQQKRVWSLQQESTAYRSQCALLIDGDLRAEALTAAFQTVAGRHEILRTTFARQPGLHFPFQVIAEDCRPSLRQLDLSACPAREQEARLDEIFRQEWERPFDLTRAPLLQLCLAKLTETRHALFVSLPAACADAQSLNNIVTEAVRFLAATQAGETEDAGEILQYADFSKWQNELLEGEGAEAGREFWEQQRLNGSTEMRVPFEATSGGPRAFTPERLNLVIEHGLYLRLRGMLPDYQVTLADFMRAAWQSLLWLHTRQTEVVIGDLCRGYQELEQAVGLFAKLLPVKCHFEANMRFAEVLKQSSAARRHAGEWQEYFAWEQYAEATEPEKNFFAASFEYNVLPPTQTTSELEVSWQRVEVCHDRFKVKLCCTEQGQFVTAELKYDSGDISAQAAALLAEQFISLLHSAVRNPESLVTELEALGQSERRRLLVEFNDVASAFDGDRCIHELFEEQAARNPHATAVVCENERLSYAELNARANQVAHRLKRLGAGPETMVGLCMERSVEMIVGLLGILKAGSAYVPLEPAQPRERLGYMIEDVRPLALLTQRHLLEGLPATAAPVIRLDADWVEMESESADNLQGGATPATLVYVIFTSGSTGRPKGVLVEHRQLVNYVRAVTERLGLTPGESFATVSTFAADLGHTAIFPSLVLGGCLHLIAQERASDPSALADYFDREPVDVLKIVPSHLEALLASATPEKVLPRRRLVLGGEAARWELADRVRGLAPACEVFNHYGPTETTVGTLTFHLGASDRGAAAAVIPLGRPIPNSKIYLLDSDLRPVATGMLGELYCGGAGLTRGYLSQPGLTAERFIPDPFSAEPGARLYRTGDLARHRPDGFVEFVGRADNQIKFHGYRVELNELRHALNQHPQIRDSVVLVANDAHGLDVLVAYYVSRQELEVGPLRAFLSTSVLKETLPSIYVHLKKLPLTLNGKVNHRALPSLEEIRRQAKQTFIAPRTPTEQQVAEVWAEVIGIERVSLQDNFFEIGGHSLLATRVTTRLRETFQIELPLRTVFEEPTVEGLALAITQLLIDQTGDEELLLLLEEVAELSGDSLSLQS
ncbi:MAG TPA: amino acid adenylation domain-containing protein [Pyrinomonadaceae bacterium]|nr:amino acid adenylation domain-containing protein [Pyrinomonadaceae bacterium]